LTHGKRTPSATLFLHGLTASPRQFAALAVHAFRAGDNVIVPRLARHGHADRMSATLRDLSADELIAGVEAQFAIATQLGATVRVVGFSLGGLLAAWLAYTQRVRETIAIAPFLGVAGVPPRLTAALAHELARRPNAFVWWNPIRRERQLPTHGYPRYSTHAIAQALGLAGQLAARARAVAPMSSITLVTNRGETAVSNAAIAQLARSWGRHGTVEAHLRRVTGIGYSHDIIEPERDRAIIDRSYPQILALLDETALPPV
jgi:carboxylesterase